MPAGSWRGILRLHLRELSWKRLREDVEPFLVSPQEVALLTHENLER